MNRPILIPLLFAANTVLLAADPPQAGDKQWIARSNGFTQMLVDIGNRHSPESASSQGLKEYDERIGQPTKADEDKAITEVRAVLAKLQTQLPDEKDTNVAQDLQIVIRRIELQLREHDFSQSHEVPFINANSYIFFGIRSLLDDQVAADRRPAAVVRLRKYVGLEPGYQPLTTLLRQRVEEQMAKPNMIYPAKLEVETELARSGNYVDGMAALFKQYKLTGWEEAYGKLKTQLADYNAWVRSTVLPKARTDFRLPPEQYALAFESFGIDISPAQITELAHQAFTEIQGNMKQVAAQVAVERHLPSSDYRDVIRELKKQQITGDAILPFYKNRLGEIEGIIKAHELVTLPSRPARIRIATPAETAQQPAPHMKPPPFLHNTGEQGEFVLPLNMPASSGSNQNEKVDDYTYDAAAWTMIAHEARPGHELQFDSMVEHGVSLARVLYAFNSTNVEGWGLYAEYITLPYMPLDGQLISLQLRLLRAARAFLDPELQAGKIQPADAMRV
ncbi:MAG: DUF885 domain-containing protein, partial [Acidobacteriaceae bacterium]|nr:DUF885 domain-containing protein [Acidobacteriaceae bacterium]